MACSAPWFKEPPLWERGYTEEKGDGVGEGRMRHLHEEIISFYEKAKPQPSEHLRRTQALERVKHVIIQLWPQAEVKPFGSFATGLYLPRTSDMDIAITSGSSSGSGSDSGSGRKPKPSILSRLNVLASALNKSGHAQEVEVIGLARIPIVKFVERQSRLSFDVRLDPEMELLAVDFIVSAMAQVRTLAPLYISIKSFLQLKKLNEVYPNGGLASYTLFVMLYTFLQVHPHGRDAFYSSPHSGLGFLLTGFFHFYGKSLNVQQYGISCRIGSHHFFPKVQRGFLNFRKPYLLAVEDPLITSNDIGKNSFNFPSIRAAFCEAYELLTSAYFNPGTSSLLSRVLPGQRAL